VRVQGPVRVPSQELLAAKPVVLAAREEMKAARISEVGKISAAEPK